MRSDLMRRIGLSVGLGVLAAAIAMAIDNDSRIGFFAFVGAALLGISIPPIIEPDKAEPESAEPAEQETQDPDAT
ncbi:MAG TPA: hypothetical protein VM238_22210 [Phycisphaerae bacterium]|nr:hypothetical protein [Phycisphaerae bacterium]